MTPLRPLVTVLAQLWYALDAANALRHGNTVSERAARHVLAESPRVTIADRHPVINRMPVAA